MSDRNPQAFPSLERGYHGLELSDPGMTLADYFAGQALAGLLASIGGPIREDCPDVAYRLALRMLAERERRGIK